MVAPAVAGGRAQDKGPRPLCISIHYRHRSVFPKERGPVCAKAAWPQPPYGQLARCPGCGQAAALLTWSWKD